ncbi:flagellar biosynthetic protein FliR [Paracoccus sp. 1_MG-2023]|uniref:flagellar biosynthetic protein FliR n=1 Tax=unclassified Paracoccus (in: a-proteobacteria) TaxID=2688777 RepID=UPI001C083A3D|nr:MULTISPECIES: flagellar biosynthetic protein FliR [unclassified Paracoccus (in: a-proteobacteria)]MBU2956827.1 flagellar biosynthetic protein FliR [Paracoccus sp. C2R09]MDO6670212.1 flagellar biosynthetic protein FliR [Paracoccus sp. 1_MG-2023]
MPDWFDWSLILVYARLQAALLVLPGLGERVVPGRVKIALALALTPLLAGQVGLRAMPGQPIGLIAQIGAETVLGLATGMMLRLMALAIDIATTAIAATASLSQIMGVQNEAAPHPIGNMLHLGGIAILMALGLPIMLVQLLADSFAIWPPASLPRVEGLTMAVIGIVTDSFRLALILAAPFTLGGFLYQALSGVISRVMPALPVVFIGAPASIMLALIALTVLSPMLIAIWADAVLGFMLPAPR